LQELVDLAAVERLFGWLAVLVPVAALAVGAAMRFGGRRQGSLRAGLLMGLLGPLNWVLWRVFNGIEDHYGLDSVRAMLLNLALFAALGVAIGLGVRALRRSDARAE
jgi:hypothetical protein